MQIGGNGRQWSMGLIKHLELHRADGGGFFIKINSLIGRLSLFADHPHFKLKQALDLGHITHHTSGDLSLIPMKSKDLYILEDKDHHGNKIQNFVFASEEISSQMTKGSLNGWIRSHIVDFFTRSISVPFFILYSIYFFTVMRYYNTTNILLVSRYITGVITLVFAVTYYYWRSVHTKSSFLRFCFKLEFVIFVVSGTVSNIYNLNSAWENFGN